MSRSFETVVAAGMITISIYVFALSAMTEKIIYVYPALAAEKEEPVQIEIIEVPQNADVKWIDYLYREAKRFGADPEKMIKVAECESRWKPQAHALTKREDSRGIFQINLYAHEDVSPEDAADPYFAISWAAEHFGNDDAHHMWVNCYKQFGNEPSTI